MSRSTTRSSALRLKADAVWSRLWAEARHCVLLLPGLFGETDALKTVGLSRRLALRCCNWLWSLEGLVRRLLVAAALRFDPAVLAPLRERREAPDSCAYDGSAGPVRARPSRFRLFACAASASAGHVRGARQVAAPYGHVPFPADDLLRLGARRVVRSHAAARPDPSSAAPALPHDATQPRRPNPLHRRGRISHWDPDYRGIEDRVRTGDFRSRPARQPEWRERTPPERVSSLHHLPDPTEWRRLEEEWQRIVPAPALAARIAALLRVIERPAGRIARLARRLSRSNLSARFAALPLPMLRRPRLDTTRAPPLQQDMTAAHRLMQFDTS